MYTFIVDYLFRGLGKKLLSFGCSMMLSLGFCSVRAQEFRTKLPGESNVIMAINLAKVVNYAEATTLNKFLERIGFFKHFNEKGSDLQKDFAQTGVDLKELAFYYRNARDSLLYGELIVPLHDINQFERLLTMQGTYLPNWQGYKRFKTDDGHLLAWNAKEFRVLEGKLGDNYFANDSIAALYGIQHIDYGASADATATEAAEYADVDTVYMDSIAMEWDATDFGGLQSEGQGQAEDVVNDDSLATVFDEVYKRNDSIKNILLEKWLLREQEHVLSGHYEDINAKEQNQLLEKLDIARIWFRKVGEIYNEFQPIHSMADAYGKGSNFSLSGEYKDLFFDLSQQGNKLTLKSSLTLSKELVKLTKKLYGRKPNAKFAKYLTEQTLGYFNVNLNTEAYLKQMPLYFEKYVEKYFGKDYELLDLFNLGLEIVFDEKAIAKIIPGDNLLLINGIVNLGINYVDYEYDDNYELKEVKRTKQEKVPSFIWMFTSDDQRMIKKALDIAVAKQVASFTRGVYTIKLSDGKDFPLYLMFKEDLVMMSNDSLQLSKILENTPRHKPNKAFVKLMKSSKFSAALETDRVVAFMKDLDLAQDSSWGCTLGEFNKYGNFTLHSKGIVGDRLETYLQIELPTKAKYGLQFIINQILNGVMPHERIEQ